MARVRKDLTPAVADLPDGRLEARPYADAKASPAERDQAVACVEAAVTAGLLAP